MPKQHLINENNSLSLKIGGYLSALLLLSTPFSTSVASIIPFILLLCWLLGKQYLTLLQTLKGNPVALFAFLLLSDFMIGASYTSASNAQAFSVLGKYRELLLVILLIPFLKTETARNWSWHALALGSALTLLSSYAMYFELIEAPHPEKSPTSIKTYITHGLFLAFFAFYCAHHALQSKKYKYLYAACILLCAYNIFFVVVGRTGQLIFLLLAMLFSVQRFNKKGIMITAILLLFFLLLFVNFSEKAQRITEGFTNMQTYFQTQTDNRFTSMGQRLTYWQHSLAMIAEKPWFGHGTGSFSNEYLRIADKESIVTSNPHNEYLMITVQLGLAGLLLFLGFLLSLFFCSLQLADTGRWLAQGVFVSLAINSLFNSSLLDHTEGHWFACLIALCFARLEEQKVLPAEKC